MLESYIAPLFTGYVDKYIKNLKPEDLSLSLWGGDLVLQNLEINLDILQQELNLPVEFLSGKIHKFQLHVPWTRLNYDPVVITINTMEFIVKLKDTNDSVLNSSEDTTNDETEKESSSIPDNNAEDLPPGYVQSILNKVMNNVTFKIQNIIIKYVEDDMVFSLNIKSLDLHSADENWDPSFVELKLPALLLRKICKITDLTICLDQRNPSGKIELYQDPVLYKCNLSCRLVSSYKSLNSFKPYENMLNVYCESFDFSFTDLQVPMVVRLIKLVIGLYYGNLDLPGCNTKLHTAPKVLDQHRLEHTRSSNTSLDNAELDVSNDSWTSWALSMVPGMGTVAEENKASYSKLKLKTTIGIYITLVTVTIKRTNTSQENVFGHQRLEFSPVLCFEVSGCVIECNVIGDLLFDLSLGLKTVVGYTISNQCVCSSLCQEVGGADGEEDSITEDNVFLKVTGPSNEDEALSFLEKSLFESYVKSTSEMVEPIEVESLDTESSKDYSLETNRLFEKVESYSDSDSREISEKFGGVFFNYFYEMYLPNLLSGEYENIFLYPDIDEKVKEVSKKRINIDSCQLYISTEFVHFLLWFVGLATNNIPERKKKTAVVLDSFVLGQLEIGNLLSREFTINVNDLETHLMTKEHEYSKFGCSSSQNEKEALVFKLKNLELLKVEPMYPVEFVSMVEKGKLVKLHKMENLNVQITLKVNGVEAGISNLSMETLESAKQILLEPTDCEASLTYSLLPDTCVTKTPCIKAESTLKCTKTSIIFTKVQAILFYLITMSWITQQKLDEIRILASSIFHDSSTLSSPLMNIQLQGLMLRLFDMADLAGISGVVSSMLTTLKVIGEDNKEKQTTIFQAPFATNKLHDFETWLMQDVTESEMEPFIQLRLQFQKENCKLVDTAIPLLGIKIAGVSVNVDQLLYTWLTHIVDSKVKKAQQSREKGLLNRSMTTSTQRRTKSYARVFGSGSVSSHSRHEKYVENLPPSEELSPVKETCTPQDEHYAEWFAKKMNFFKLFHLQIDIEPTVIVLPTDSWHSGFDTFQDVVQLVSRSYKGDALSSNALVVCLPKFLLSSASDGIDIFEFNLPMILKQKRKTNETFPWTINCKDLTVFTLFPEKNDRTYNEKIETIYICKPFSWTVYLASSTQSSDVSKSIANLGIIPETDVSALASSGKVVSSNIMQEKIGNHLTGKSALGFVLHMDCSICECFVWQKQLFLISSIVTKVYNICNSVAIMEADKDDTPSVSGAGTTKTNKIAGSTKGSISTASIVDQAEAMSTITGSSNAFTNTKSFSDAFDVSLWIQCTLPKVKCTVLSFSNDNSTIYQVTSEIDEIMFAFDYKDKVLELTNKIADCVIYYSLLRFDNEPAGWMVIDNNYLLSYSDIHHSSHVESKTLLSIIYRRTYQHSTSILSPEESESYKKLEDMDQSSSNAGLIQEEHITKHELYVNILPLDLICFSKPILSSLNVFTQLLPDILKSQASTGTEPDQPIVDQYISVMTLPLLDIHCDSLRVIIPVGEVASQKNYCCIDNTESVFLFHFQSLDLHSSPINPIGKTVIDRSTYRQVKQSYKDVLKRLKLWNVQYQLDLSNIGLCTTNWQSLESSLPGKRPDLQNPALEWNSHPGYGQQVMTPIFPGFDFKATIAPPIISKSTGQLHSCTAAAFEFHSPKEIKIFLNTNQVELALDFVHEINTLVLEVTQILQESFPNRKSSACESDFTPPKGHSETKITNDDFFLPSIELFSSVSCISIALYSKKFEQPLISTINPAFFINIMQPTFSFASVKEVKVQLKLHNLEIISSSNPSGISCESPVPLLGDFDLPLLSCGVGYKDPKTGAIPSLLNISTYFENLDDVSLDIRFEKPLIVQYNIALDENIKLFIGNVNKVLDKNIVKENKVDGINKEDLQCVEKSGQLAFRIKTMYFASKRIYASLSASENTNDVSINTSCQEIKTHANVVYSMSDDSVDTVNIECQFSGADIYFVESGNKSLLLMPCNLDVNFAFDFSLHSGNNLHKSSLPKIYLYLQCGLLQLHVNQQLYRLILDLSSKMSDMMGEDNTERDTDGINDLKKDVSDWCLGLEKSEDDLRNGSFKYNVLEEDEMTPQDNELFFTDDHYSFSPIIMWKYPQPRVVTDLSVLPVPFHISNEVEAGSRRLPCLLQYWDKLNGRFVTSIQFFVSENESSSNTVAEEKSIASVECSSAKIWRVIIGVSKDSEYIDDEHDDDDGEYDGDATNFSPPELSVVPASSLVACMKVNSVYSPKLIPSIELKSSFAKLRMIFSSSDSSLGTGSPSDFSPFYLDKETYPDLIEAIEIVFDDLHCSASFTNNLRIVLEVSSKFQINLIDFNNLCWLKFFDVYQVYAKTSLNLVGESSMDKLALELDLGATELFLTQTSMHTLAVTSQAWMNIMNDEPEFLLFHHYILCNETDEIIHLQQINTDEDIILHSGQLYPYCWSSNSSKSIHFCLNAPGDWKWSEPLSLDQVGIFPRKLEHKKLTSLVFVEVKKISGIQFQVIFHGSCSLKNLLDFDLKLCFEINETLFSTIHPTVVNKISKEFVIQAGATRPSLCISPSFIKSIGFSKHTTESNVSRNQFVISIPQQEDDSHFTIQIQDGKKSLLCWLSFDYTSDIMGQLVVTISPKFIFRNHFPHPIHLKAVEKDSSAYVEMTIPGKGKESQVFDLFPERWYDLFFSIQSSYSATGISLNTSMYQSIKEIDQNISDKELNESNWPFMHGTKLSSLAVSDSGMYNWFEHIEFEDAQDIHMAKKMKHHNKCSFQYTLPNSSTPTIMIDVKPHVLLINMADMDLFVNTDDNCIEQQTSTSLAPIQDLKVGISVGERVIWSSKLVISTKTLQQVTKQKMLAPDTVTHCSIIDDIRKRSYQLSFSCRKVHEMLCITVAKRFVLHNLSNSHLMMTPLIFSEFKREHVFDQISAIQIPPKSDTSFSMLNLYTTLPNQVPDGMALNFQLTTNDLKTNSNDEIQLNEYRFTESDSLLLSNEHLRETLFLSDENSDRHPFVLTSGLDNGIVHVYVDEDSSVVVEFHNHCELDLMMKEQSLQSKHAEVFSTDISSMTMLLSKTKVSYQPLSFKESFPKTDNTLEINCQFSLFSGDAAELSQPINIKEDTSHKLFIPNYGEIFVKARVNSCKLYVDVDTVDNEKTMVVSKHSTVPLFNFTLSSINAVLIDFSNHEVMLPLISAFFSKVVFKHTVIEAKSTFSLTCGFLQFDNQVTNTLDHFPVLFLPLREVSERYHSMTEDVPFLDVEASLEEDTFTLTFELENSPEGGCFVDNIRFKMQPCEMYIEDTMIYRLANVFYTYLPRQTNKVCGNTKELEARCLSVLHPLRLHNIEIEKISILLSFHASVKVFLAADHIPLVFSPLKVTPTMTVTKEFIRFLLYTYATQALVRVGWILGSFNIIGSPTGLIQSIGHGLTDFFVLPYNGLIRGPTAFVSGLSLGMTSLMRHFSTGALTSINNVTSSISRNMDRLSFDDLHLIMQEENRAESPTKVSKGFSKAFEVLGMSFLGAVAGIVDHPIQNVTEAQNTSEVLSGIATGFAKGIVGMFTKPIGGAMEFLSQASQGILQGAGLVKIPIKIYSVERKLVELLVGRESKMKYMHFVPSESYAQLFVAPAKIIRNIGEDKEKECYSGVLVLTDSTLLVYNSDISQVASIISLTEVELVRLEDESMCRLQIKKHTNEQQINKASLDENPNFRQFFDSFRDAAVASHTEVLCQNLSTQSDYTVTEVQLDPIFGDLLLTLCEGRKTYLFEETCIVECVDL